LSRRRGKKTSRISSTAFLRTFSFSAKPPRRFASRPRSRRIHQGKRNRSRRSWRRRARAMIKGCYKFLANASIRSRSRRAWSLHHLRRRRHRLHHLRLCPLPVPRVTAALWLSLCAPPLVCYCYSCYSACAGDEICWLAVGCITSHWRSASCFSSLRSTCASTPQEAQRRHAWMPNATSTHRPRDRSLSLGSALSAVHRRDSNEGAFPKRSMKNSTGLVMLRAYKRFRFRSVRSSRPWLECAASTRPAAALHAPTRCRDEGGRLALRRPMRAPPRTVPQAPAHSRPSLDARMQ